VGGGDPSVIQVSGRARGGGGNPTGHKEALVSWARSVTAALFFRLGLYVIGITQRQHSTAGGMGQWESLREAVAKLGCTCNIS
jgi:hypothetical protein